MLPSVAESLLAAVMKIQDRIMKGEQAKKPQGEHRLGAPGDGFIDRRARKQAWAKDDKERLAQGLPPRGVVPFRVLNNEETETEPEHHG